MKYLKYFLFILFGMFLSSCDIESFLNEGLNGFLNNQTLNLQEPDNVIITPSEEIFDSIPEENLQSKYYTITYDFNDDNNTTFTSSVKDGEKAVNYSADNATKLGYIFDSWTYNDGTEYDFNKEVHSDLKLFGKWTIDPNYNVGETIKYNVIIYYNDDSNRIDEYKVIAGESLHYINMAFISKENYTFSHFADKNNKEVNINDPIFKDTFIYAHWIKNNPSCNVFIDYNVNDYIEKLVIEEGSCVNEPVIDVNSKEGYTFKGWFDVSGNEFDFYKPIYTDTFINAKWEVSQYTITYDTNGSDSYYETQTFKYGDLVYLPYPNEIKGHYFSGWQDENGSWYGTEGFEIYRNLNLKAIYNPHTYWVNLTCNDGWYDYFNNNVEYNSKFTLPMAYDYNGNNFMYWMDNYGNIYYPNEYYEYTFNDSIELFAIFESASTCYLVINDIYYGRNTHYIYGKYYLYLDNRETDGKSLSYYEDQNGNIYYPGEYVFNDNTFLTAVYEDILYTINVYDNGLIIDSYSLKCNESVSLPRYIDGKYVYYVDDYGNSYYDNYYHNFTFNNNLYVRYY